jgi:hypothetical protein
MRYAAFHSECNSYDLCRVLQTVLRHFGSSTHSLMMQVCFYKNKNRTIWERMRFLLITPTINSVLQIIYRKPFNIFNLTGL